MAFISIRKTNQITFPIMNNQHQIIVFETGRKKTIVFNQYCYQINGKTPTTICLRCSAKCGVTITNDPHLKNVLKEPGSHDHNENEENMSEIEFRQKLKKKINKDPTQVLKKVYDNVLTKTRNERSSVPVYKSVSSTIQRYRAKKLPACPLTFSTKTKGKWAKTFEASLSLSKTTEKMS